MSIGPPKACPYLCASDATASAKDEARMSSSKASTVTFHTCTMHPRRVWPSRWVFQKSRTVDGLCKIDAKPCRVCLVYFAGLMGLGDPRQAREAQLIPSNCALRPAQRLTIQSNPNPLARLPCTATAGWDKMPIGEPASKYTL